MNNHTLLCSCQKSVNTYSDVLPLKVEATAEKKGKYLKSATWCYFVHVPHVASVDSVTLPQVELYEQYDFMNKKIYKLNYDIFLAIDFLSKSPFNGTCHGFPIVPMFIMFAAL